MTNTINLFKYGKPHPADERIRYYSTLEEGRETAEKCGLKEAVLAGPVDILICGGYSSYEGKLSVKESWVKGFVGATAREVGIELFLKNVRVNGNLLQSGCGVVAQYAISYLRAEQKRLERTVEEQGRKNGTTTWIGPHTLLIPDIGTVVELVEDWTFRLYSERRNSAILKKVGTPETRSYELKVYDVTVKAGSTLGVDRVYIRKGGEDFSSITFNLKKGGEIMFNGKAIKAQGRFWAKLSDVNKMKVRIDFNTLAEN